jgi:riboflavin biosynthesis pyrimidine reductase
MIDWRERFERWAEQKTQRAAAATLPRYVTELEQPPQDTPGIGNAWTTELFDGLFYLPPPRDPGRPACSAVFVQSADGNTGGHDPAALGGGETDKHVIYEGLSRVAAHAVLAGANTVRGGDLLFSVWHPELVRLRASLALPRHPVQIVATGRGLDLESALIANVPEVPLILLVTPAALHAMQPSLPARPWITTMLLEDADPRGAFLRLASMGIDRVSCVGGRTLASSLFDARLLDDVCLTTAPRPGGEPGTPLHRSPWRGAVIVRKRGTDGETGVTFEQIVTARATAP